MSEPAVAREREQVLAALRAHERFVLATHEHPDGDAVGSLIGMHVLLEALGKDSVMFMPADDLPLPREYRALDLSGVVTEAPGDLEERVIVFLDCGNSDRNPAGELKRTDAVTLNIDHHHDNTRFGTVDHVVAEASCTAEIVWELALALGVRPDRRMADALYVGLVTDTGCFMYETTGPRSHAMAADLIERGVDVHGIYRQLYEDVPEAKLALLARALDGMQRHLDGLLTVTRLSREDFTGLNAEESFSEGVVDHLRAVEGTAVAALVRELLADGRAGESKVSLRSADDRVDVSAIARLRGGGGHRRAAGFSTDMSWEESVRFIEQAVRDQLASGGEGDASHVAGALGVTGAVDVAGALGVTPDAA